MRFGLSTFLLVRVYEDSRRAQFAHGQESVQGVPLSLRSALALFVWPCEVRALFLPIPRSGLERDCCSRLEPFWRVRVFFLRWRCMLRACCRMLDAIRRGLTEAYVILQANSSSEVMCQIRMCSDSRSS